MCVIMFVIVYTHTFDSVHLLKPGALWASPQEYFQSREDSAYLIACDAEFIHAVDFLNRS